MGISENQQDDIIYYIYKLISEFDGIVVSSKDKLESVASMGSYSDLYEAITIDIRKEVNKVYNASEKDIHKVNKVLKDYYKNIKERGIVFCVCDDVEFMNMLKVSLSFNNNIDMLSELNTSGLFNIGIDNYTLIYVMSDDIFVISHIRVGTKIYLHSFCTTVYTNGYQSVVVMGEVDNANNYVYKDVLCNYSVICPHSKKCLCTKSSKYVDSCMNMRVLKVIELIGKIVLGTCLPKGGEGIVKDKVIESFVKQNYMLSSINTDVNKKMPVVLIGNEEGVHIETYDGGCITIKGCDE